MPARDETAASPAAAMPADTAALAAGLVTVTAWGSAFVGIRSAGAALSPGSLALGRLLVSTAILGTIALVRREPLPARRNLAAIAAYGVLWLGIYNVVLNAAERRVDAGVAAMLVNTGPILIAIFAGIFLREGFPPGLFAGCAVAFTGVALIGIATARSSSGSGVGAALCIAAAFAYSIAVVVQKPVLGRVPAFQVTWIGCAVATVACLPFAPGLASDAAGAGASAIAWTIYLGAVPTAVGFATWSFALGRTSAGRMASLTYLAPPVAVVLGWAVLGERPPWLAVAGGALCLAGVYLARRRGRGRSSSTRSRSRFETGGREYPSYVDRSGSGGGGAPFNCGDVDGPGGA
ncbi:MAG TPA: DMT family transporter [Gaiellales bacterium]|jgi:drug/metabolite transporter (DMT)-like permease|nr:DMT family transporter [Gaiellales bacterium]